ncbi:MAG: LacI family DNA-binding transcriptional regulator [Anaerolineae bacterium]
MTKKLTIYDIAELAGVSPATVSRVLNNSGPVRQSTRDAVEDVIREHDYRPNVLAQSLSTKQSRTIGFILPDITNPFFATVFLEAEKRALELGYTVMLGNSLNDTEIESRNLRSLLEKQVDGIIFMGGRVNEDPPKPEHVAEMAEVLEAVPLVMVNGKMPAVDCWHVYSDEAQGIREAVAYLCELGHEHIEMIGGVPGNLTTDIKIDAFRRALEDHGLPTAYARTIPGRWSVEDGMVCLQQLLERGDLPTALIAINDLIAIGVMLKARERGLEIPGDLSLIGIDDIYWARIFRPHLTTISQNYGELGPTAVDVVMALGHDQPLEKEITVPTQLVIRDSCCEVD